MTQISPVEIKEPTVVILALLLSILNHFYPKHIMPYLRYRLYTTSDMRRSFEMLYNEYLIISIQAEALEGKTSDFAQLSLLKRKLSNIFRQLEKYPKVYWEPYPMTNQTRKLFSILDSSEGGGNGGDRLNKMLNRLEINPLDWLLGYLPTFFVFFIYLSLLIIYGWSYELFVYNNDITKLNLEHSGVDQGSSIFKTLLYIISWLPSSLLSTLSSASTSFWMLYFIFKTTISHILPTQ